MPRASIVVVLLLGTAGCNYLADRGLDFVDQYRINAGVGTAVGVRGRTGGVVDTGLMLGVKPRATALGVKYGDVLWADFSDPRIDADQAEIVKTSSLIATDWGKGSYFSGRNSLALLPAVFSWVDATPRDYEWQVPEQGDLWEDGHWLWSSTGFRDNRYQQIHAFDFEIEAGLLLYLDLGYSPGELLDFVLGVFLIDLAKDDGRL